MNKTALIGFALALAGCGRQKVVEARVAPSAHENLPPRHQVRATGKVRAVRSYAIQVPQIVGANSSRLTLIKLAANGAEVHEGDVVAEFDSTQEAENARQAQAKFDDLSHQVEQKQAQNRSEAETRSPDLQKAAADLAKARIDRRKGPILSEIDTLKNEAKPTDAHAHLR